MPDEYKAGHVIFVITTDGMENSSHKYSYEQIKRKIGHETEKYGWEFIFMGANIDAVAEAARIGISADRAVTYLADEEGTAVMYDAVAAVTCCARSSASRPSGAGRKASSETVASGAAKSIGNNSCTVHRWLWPVSWSQGQHAVTVKDSQTTQWRNSFVSGYGKQIPPTMADANMLDKANSSGRLGQTRL